MKLLFSVPREQLDAQRDRIFAAVSECVPGAYTEIDAARGILAVELPDGASPSVAEALRVRLLTVGVTATRVDHTQTGGAFHREEERRETFRQAPPPPININIKQPRTVRLSVFIPVLIAVALVCSILFFNIGTLLPGLFTGGNTLGSGEEKSEDYVQKIALIDYIFENYGLYDTNGQVLLDEMLKAYAKATGDEYAEYYTDEELAALMADMEGAAVGVGISVTMDTETGNIIVIQVYPDSPAQKAGVRPGDLIVAIGEGESEERVSSIGYDIAMQKMLGEEGTTAHFTVLREGEELPFAITREKFTAVSVDGRVSTTDQKVGIVRISGFEANTPAQFKTVMNTLSESGCERFVFDVRNNPGGEQKSVMAVLSYFLNENDTIMSVVSKDGTTTYYLAEETEYEGDYAACSVAKEEIGMYRDYPMVVLTNGYTASAGELFTAGLADYELATVVGEKTFGKGVIQSIYDLSTMGYSGGLKLTVGYYTGPSCENYDGVGITPDTVVEPAESMKNKNLYLLTEAEDNQLSAAIEAVLAK